MKGAECGEQMYENSFKRPSDGQLRDDNLKTAKLFFWFLFRVNCRFGASFE